MGRPHSTRTCSLCGKGPVIKNGSRNGRIRYRCRNCGQNPHADSARRPDITALAQFNGFRSYILGKLSQHDLTSNSGRSLRRQYAWCWKVPTPRIDTTGEVYIQVFIDGIYLPYNWCLLVARNTEHVIAWQWTTSENSAAYANLLKGIAPPDLVTTDGNNAALAAISELWPDTPIQRCLIHVHRNNRRDLSLHPKTNAGRALLKLSTDLLAISTTTQAAHWESLLLAFHTQYEPYLKERTYAKDVPATQRRKGRTWWYTHDRDRKVYFRLARLTRKGHLFTYLSFTPTRERTTNPVESINALIRELPRTHRGLTEEHLITAIEWLCYTRSENPLTNTQILKQWNTNGQPERRTIPTKKTPPPPAVTSPGPKQYDTAITTEDSLWNRHGWAGRWKP